MFSWSMFGQARKTAQASMWNDDKRGGAEGAAACLCEDGFVSIACLPSTNR